MNAGSEPSFPSGINVLRHLLSKRYVARPRLVTRYLSSRELCGNLAGTIFPTELCARSGIQQQRFTPALRTDVTPILKWFQAALRIGMKPFVQRGACAPLPPSSRAGPSFCKSAFSSLTLSRRQSSQVLSQLRPCRRSERQGSRIRRERKHHRIVRILSMIRKASPVIVAPAPNASIMNKANPKSENAARGPYTAA
jgi:hypothetical protein